MEETVKEAVKKATIPLLAEIEAYKYEKLTWKINYEDLYKKYENVYQQNEFNKKAGTLGWITSGVELFLLILTWSIPK